VCLEEKGKKKEDNKMRIIRGEYLRGEYLRERRKEYFKNQMKEEE
jgi:hypothetical protein